MGRAYNPRADLINQTSLDRADRAPNWTPFNADPAPHITSTIYAPDADETEWARRAVHHHAVTPAEAADLLAMLNLTETP